MTTIEHAIPAANRLPALIVLLRPRQWIKNGFLLAPLFFSPDIFTGAALLRVFLGIACFCAVSSAVYVFNDYRDRATDRLHPQKRLRPLAAGTVPLSLALAAIFLLLAMGLAGAFALQPAFGRITLAYVIINLLYSLWLKHISIIDVMVVASGFVLRVFAGSILAGVQPGPWILIMTGLLALFIAMAKRRDDLVIGLTVRHRRVLQGYTLEFLNLSVGILLGALLVSYLICTTDQALVTRLGTDRLYFTAPFVIGGILRYLQLMLIEKRTGAPTDLMFEDKPLIGFVGGWAVTCAALMYWH